MGEFRMPSLGADMEAGTLVEWLVEPGDKVKRGDVIAVVETQKGAIEIEVFEDGVVDEFLVDIGTEVPVGTPLATIRGEGEAPPEGKAVSERGAEEMRAPEKPAKEAAERTPRPEPRPLGTLVPSGPERGRVRASPAARKLAAEKGVDLSAIEGTGPGGAVTRADVAQVKGKSPAEGRPSRGPVSAMQEAIAKAMARSKREIPHYYLSSAIDMEPAMTWLEATNAERPVPERLIHGVLFIRAVALALGEFPELNGYYEEDGFRPSEAVHAGVAISLRGGGLIVPALHDAESKDLDALMAGFRDLVKRARTARLRSSELSDATITVTSLGEDGVDGVFPIIYPPQVAIVGFGTVLARPWTVDGEIVSRRVVTASLAGDHRVSNGHRGGQFLRRLGELLLEPEAL